MHTWVSGKLPPREIAPRSGSGFGLGLALKLGLGGEGQFSSGAIFLEPNVKSLFANIQKQTEYVKNWPTF